MKIVTRAECSSHALVHGNEKDFSCLLLEEDNEVTGDTQVECTTQLSKQS